MTTDKTMVADALSPTLSAFHSIADKPLESVRQVCQSGSLEKLVLCFGHNSLILVADENDDSICVSMTDNADSNGFAGTDASHLQPWNNLIGKPFGWGWVTVNQQGYGDGLLLSFGGIVPQIVLNVIASSIKVGTIAAVD